MRGEGRNEWDIENIGGDKTSEGKKGSFPLSPEREVGVTITHYNEHNYMATT